MPASPLLLPIITEMQKKWPENRTINLVFHGHSVPSGYFITPRVKMLDSYPHMVWRALCKRYQYAVINCIVTAIGGENSLSGARRFQREVLRHSPDVLLIDYALNDRFIPITRARQSWQRMIEQALAKNIVVVLLTPTFDREQYRGLLDAHIAQIRELAQQYPVILGDVSKTWQNAIHNGMDLDSLLSQRNHPNRNGHTLAAQTILELWS